MTSIGRRVSVAHFSFELPTLLNSRLALDIEEWTEVVHPTFISKLKIMKTLAKIDPLLSLMEIPPGYLNVMGYVDESAVNGPGCRAVVWLQGCHRHCSGCFNPQSWSFGINELISVDRLFQSIINNPNNEGVTFSGGEPFWQAPSLAVLAERLKAEGLNTMAFTGFTLERLQAPYAPAGAQALLDQLDLLMDGPYIEAQAIHHPNVPVSSLNQQVHIFNPDFDDRITWASDQLEVHILQDGSRIITGYQGKVDAP